MKKLKLEKIDIQDMDTIEMKNKNGGFFPAFVILPPWAKVALGALLPVFFTAGVITLDEKLNEKH